MASTLAALQRPDAAAPAATLPLDVRRTTTFDTPAFVGMTFHEVEAKSALNRVKGMPFPWSINPYRGCSHACSYCFARPTHSYLNFSPGADFERQIVVKINCVEVLQRELARPSWRREHVAMGTNTDPYQRAEGRYRLMPGIIDALTRADTPFSILTKGTLITRDIPALQHAARRVDVAAALTIGMIDRRLWRRAESGTPSPAARLAAVRRLTAAGIPTGVMLAPIMPGLNDDPDDLSALVEAAAAAGAVHISPIVLHLRREVRGVFWPWLEREHPDLVPRYERLYARGGTADPAYSEPVLAHVAAARRAAWRRHPRPRVPASWRGGRDDRRAPVAADPTLPPASSASSAPSGTAAPSAADAAGTDASQPQLALW